MVQTFEGGRRQRVENTLASWPFYSFVQPCNELLAETITARRTIRCVLVVSKPVCWSLLFARKPTPNLFGIAFRFCNASLPGGAMLRLEHLAFPFVLAIQSQLRGLSTRV